MNTKTRQKKGFTIVELVIVIAVIAILAAVLIPTFANLVKKANLSADQVAVRDMNVVLAADEAENGKPDETAEVNRILAAAGYNIDDLKPMTADHKFYWCSEENIIILIDCSNANDLKVVFPEDATFNTNCCTPLGTPLPNATMTELKNEQLNVALADNFDLKLDAGIAFDAATDYASDPNYDKFKDWHCDFTISFNKSFDSGIDDNAQNATLESGKIGFMLAGQYDQFSDNWVALRILKANAGEQIRVLKDVLDEQTNYGGAFDYSFIAGTVGQFNCGIRAVYDNSFSLVNAYQGTFDYDNQSFDADGADKALLDGMIVTVQLRMYEVDESGNETGESYVVKTYTYTYNVD